MPTLPLLMNLLKMLFEFVVCCRLVELVKLVKLVELVEFLGGGGSVLNAIPVMGKRFYKASLHKITI